MNLFNLQSNPTTFPSGTNIKFSSFAAPLAQPISNRHEIVDVVNDYKWTKTLKEGREYTPFLRLREMYVTRSAFFSNLSYAANVFTDTTEVMTDIQGKIGERIPLVGDYIKRGADSAGDIAKQLGDFAGGPGDRLNNEKHLTPYYNLYGVEQSGFIYKIPYLEDTIKGTGSSWGGSSGSGDSINKLVTGTAAKLFSAAGAIEEGYTMEFAKGYSVPKDGPSVSTTIYLDNTKDISDSDKDTSWNRNWQLIYLLTYQSLPNRKTRFINQPPTIYELTLDGIQYLPYCFTSKMSVKGLGVRKRKKVSYSLDGNIVEAWTTIPEVYELSIEWQSLVTDTKNLYYESLKKKGVNFKLED